MTKKPPLNTDYVESICDRLIHYYISCIVNVYSPRIVTPEKAIPIAKTVMAGFEHSFPPHTLSLNNRFIRAMLEEGKVIKSFKSYSGPMNAKSYINNRENAKLILK